MKKKFLLFIFAFFSIVGWGPFSFISSSTVAPINPHAGLNQEAKAISAQATNLDPAVLKLGLTAYHNARKQGLDNKQLLTIIDYSKPSSQRRLWVVDLKNDKVLFNTWVAHGKNSGGVKATSFSNNPSSLKSSLGVFVTSNTYTGKHGTSLRVEGLEHG
ncbi:MAG: murein L,D-transpeptidase catalytic domain family protein, partial [Gammaproteobacteria bacterium]